MKKLVFGEGLMLPTLMGEKRITLRRYRAGAHDFKAGEVILGEFKDGFNILLEITQDTDVKPFSDLTNLEAQEDGFDSATDAFMGLKEYYPDLKLEDLLATIHFQLVQINGVPAVSLNEHSYVES